MSSGTQRADAGPSLVAGASHFRHADVTTHTTKIRAAPSASHRGFA